MAIISGASAATRMAPARGTTSITAARQVRGTLGDTAKGTARNPARNTARSMVRGLVASAAIVAVGYAIGRSRRSAAAEPDGKLHALESRLAGLERDVERTADQVPAPPATAVDAPVPGMPGVPVMRSRVASLGPVVRPGQIDKPYAVTHYEALANQASRERQIAEIDRRLTAIEHIDPRRMRWLEVSAPGWEDRRHG
jgi:hypothetical protein